MSVSRTNDVAWLLLTFTLPGRRGSKRVEVWRKLQRYGTVPLGNSGYLLPNSAANEERFQWLATSVRKNGGEASVVRVQSIDNISTPQLIARFRESRGKDYQELLRELEQSFETLDDGQRMRRLARLRSRFQEIREVDFFSSPLQNRVGELLAAAAKHAVKPIAQLTKIQLQDFKNRLWVTRSRPGVDRSASAWLIRRFIDPKGRFGFVREELVPQGAVPFDTFQSEGFGHRGDDCTIETLQKVFRIRDRKVKAITEIIHDTDISDEKFGRKEGFGIDEVLKGWARQGVPDAELLERGMQLIEGLYQAMK